jgi:hypothetical protein
MTDPGVAPSPSGAGADGPTTLGNALTVEERLTGIRARHAEVAEWVSDGKTVFSAHRTYAEDVGVLLALLAEQRELIGRLRTALGAGKEAMEDYLWGENDTEAMTRAYFLTLDALGIIELPEEARDGRG